jgi:hypothetical protein
MPLPALRALGAVGLWLALWPLVMPRADAQEKQGPRAARSYYYEVWGVGSQSLAEERPW